MTAIKEDKSLACISNRYLLAKEGREKQIKGLPVTSRPFKSPLQLCEHVKALVDFGNNGICSGETSLHVASTSISSEARH